VFALPGDALAPAVDRLLAAADAGRGVVVCLPAEADERCAALLLEATHAIWPERDGATFVVVETEGGGGGAFARTLRLESHETAVCVVSVPADEARAASWVAAEALGAAGYSEAHYDREGVRREPRLAVLEGSAAPAPDSSSPLAAADVLLVTGGGKGIAAECALDLARWSGARLAIVGRSRPENDATLAANLARIGAAGVTHRYFSPTSPTRPRCAPRCAPPHRSWDRSPRCSTAPA